MNQSSLIIPLMLAAMAVFMFMSIRNQKKRAAASAEMQSSVVAGSRVQLHSGLFGVIVDADGDDTVKIEVAPGVVTEWNRLAIREVLNDADASDEADDSEGTADDDYDVPDSPAALDKLTKDSDPDDKSDEK